MADKPANKGCKFVARKPYDRCGVLGEDSTYAFESCPAACFHYIDWLDKQETKAKAMAAKEEDRFL